MAPLDPHQFYQIALQDNDISATFGVPDSCFKGLLSFLATKSISEHVVTASEGAAVAAAAGYYLSTGKLALAYMQNSGYANALNPLQSLAAKEVFGIPMLLMIGWRGRPGEHDEPEHMLAGPRTLDNLKANDFPFEIIPDTVAGAKECIARLIAKARQDNTPVALVVPRDTFAPYKGPPRRDSQQGGVTTAFTELASPKVEQWLSAAPDLPLSRELTIRTLLSQMQSNDVSVSSVGGNSREIYMVRKERGESLSQHFLSIGAMGHTLPIAFGVSMGFSAGRVFCIEGDGSFLMHAGNNAVLAAEAPKNVIHVVIHNGIHCSTGSQFLPISKEHFFGMAAGLPYKQKFFVDTEEALKKAVQSATKSALIVVAVNESVSKNLPRPSETPFELRDVFMGSFIAAQA